MPASSDRPAFYALGRGRLGDLVTLLHPPYTAWHLAYVVIGAQVAADGTLSAAGGTVSKDGVKPAN